jgi:hypothetical protein
MPYEIKESFVNAAPIAIRVVQLAAILGYDEQPCTFCMSTQTEMHVQAERPTLHVLSVGALLSQHQKQRDPHCHP